MRLSFYVFLTPFLFFLQANCGDIKVRTNKGEGAEFIIHLPVT